MVKIAIEAGHGTNTAGKRTPDGEREWSFNNKVALAIIAKLSTYDNVQILRLDDPTGITDVPLVTRTNKANSWGADVLVSAHHNALAGAWGGHGGVETYVHPTGSRASYDITGIVQPRITKAMGLRDRGVKQFDLHMLRESNMPAILTEGGFMDSTTDIGALRSDAKLKAQGVAIAEGLATYFKLKPNAVLNNPTEPVNPLADIVPRATPNKGIGVVRVLQYTVLRFSPDDKSVVIRQLLKDEEYIVYSLTNGWYNAGGNAWIHSGSIFFLPTNQLKI